MSRTSKKDRLYEIALEQDGFFTARQARQAGYADNTHPYHVRAGNWIREYRGIYRLARYPLAERWDLILWQIWSQNRQGEVQGTFSHDTALDIHELSDVNPARVHMTVPKGFRRMAPTPKILRLHYGHTTSDDVETHRGVRITSPLRTLLDIISDDTFRPDLRVQAVEHALRRGLVTRRQLETAPLSARARRRVAQVMRLLSHDALTPVRKRQSASSRAGDPPARTRAPRKRADSKSASTRGI